MDFDNESHVDRVHMLYDLDTDTHIHKNLFFQLCGDSPLA